jgi:hypothetical protein
VSSRRRGLGAGSETGRVPIPGCAQKLEKELETLLAAKEALTPRKNTNNGYDIKNHTLPRK